jgi:hypothetical protein
MTELVFIVSRSEPKQYLYLKHFYADDHREVILDRRAGERRRNQRPPPLAERRRTGYSMTWSARSSSVCGIVSPSAFAVLRLITNSNCVACSMGRSPGLAPRRILST